MEVNIIGVGQIAITVQDIERARNFYQNQLGLTYLFSAGNLVFFRILSIVIDSLLLSCHWTPELCLAKRTLPPPFAFSRSNPGTPLSLTALPRRLDNHRPLGYW